MSATVWNYALGYVMIRVDGCAARFINACAQNGIALRDINACGENSLTARVRAGQFKRLRPIARRARVKVALLQKRGYPFSGSSFSRRPVLVLGGVAAAIGLTLASGRVWNISVSGCETVREERVLGILEQNGVKPLMRVSELDMTAAEKALESDESILWAGARLNGLFLSFDIIESRTFLSGSDVPCDVVAKCDAILDRLTVQTGLAAAEQGSAVKAGDVLISGTLPAKENAPERYVRARGTATGRMYCVGQSYVQRTSVRSARTGRFEDAAAVQLFGQSAPQSSAFEDYEAELIGVSELSDFFLPLKAVTQRRYELARRQVTLADAELERLAGEQARDKARALVDKEGSILREQLDVKLEEGGAKAVCVVEASTDIGRLRLIELPEQTPEVR